MSAHGERALKTLSLSYNNEKKNGVKRERDERREKKKRFNANFSRRENTQTHTGRRAKKEKKAKINTKRKRTVPVSSRSGQAHGGEQISESSSLFISLSLARASGKEEHYVHKIKKRTEQNGTERRERDEATSDGRYHDRDHRG